MEWMKAMTVALLVGFGLVYVTGEWMRKRLFQRLRAKHENLYESLGRPTLFGEATLENKLRLSQWIWKREFKGTGDRGVIQCAAAVLMIEKAQLALLIALLLSIFLLVIHGLSNSAQVP